ncbi:hypothetical protein F5Y18DRAFT_429471 [Xylariaceae sp. FL1019]|nr:hypothetical protein F5Y18DRAFT_429471 [Xylariaceae sp. FL1019]
MCVGGDPDHVCGRPLSQAAKVIRFHPSCRRKKTAWLPRTVAQQASLEHFQISTLMRDMYGEGRSPTFLDIVQPKVIDSLKRELAALLKNGTVEASLDHRGVRIDWPEWTLTWALPNWNGDQGEAYGKALLSDITSEDLYKALLPVDFQQPIVGSSLLATGIIDAGGRGPLEDHIESFLEGSTVRDRILLGVARARALSEYRTRLVQRLRDIDGRMDSTSDSAEEGLRDKAYYTRQIKDLAAELKSLQLLNTELL